MTKLISGKRYRVTVEGVARDGNALRLDEHTCLYHNVLSVSTIELLPDPLPTTPGSVIRHGIIGIAMRRHDTLSTFQWIDGYGDARTDNELHGATVLFDAGTDKEDQK